MNHKEHVDELLKTAAFMANKLEQAMDALERQPMVVPYDNGGGQVGMRRNPWWDAFLSSVSVYAKVVAELQSMPDTDTGKLVSSLASFQVVQGRRVSGE